MGKLILLEWNGIKKLTWSFMGQYLKLMGKPLMVVGSLTVKTWQDMHT